MKINQLYTPLESDPVADVIFVHGLGGDWKETWHPKDKPDDFWPRWIGEDIRDISVWSIDYPASSTRWSQKGPGTDLSERATMVLDYLANEGFGNRPVLFVCHSLGGLLVKKILHKSFEINQKKWQKILNNTEGILFLSTPHNGSSLANLARAVKIYYASKITLNLRKDDRALKDLNLWFKNHCTNKNLKVGSYYETEPVGKRFWLLNLFVVSEDSANPGVPNCISIPCDGNHFTICKPEDRTLPIYTGALAFIKDSIQELIYDKSQSKKQNKIAYLYSQNLPDKVIGRETLIDNLVMRFTSEGVPSMVTLHGMPGVGKTTLAAEISKKVMDDYNYNIFWADFNANQGELLPILSSWARQCGIPEIDAIKNLNDRLFAISNALHDFNQKNGEILVVFDDVRENLKYQWLNSAFLLKNALPNNTNLLVTTRNSTVSDSLKIEEVEVEELLVEDSVELIQYWSPGTSKKDARTIAQLTGKLPLAMEIATSLAKKEGADWVIKNLSEPTNRLDFLKIGQSGLKHDSVKKCFEISYLGLPDNLATIFRMLGTFTFGDICIDWIEDIVKASYPDDDPRVGSINIELKGLLQLSLVKQVNGCIRLHPLISDFAKQLLDVAEEKERVVMLYVQHFSELAIVAQKTDENKEIEFAIPNIIQSINFAYQKEQWDLVVKAGASIAAVNKRLHSKGYWIQAMKVLSLCIRAAEKLSDSSQKAYLLNELGSHNRESGEYTQAHECFSESINISTHESLVDTYVNALYGQGYVYLYQANYPHAIKSFEKVIEVAKDTNNFDAVGESYRGLGRVFFSKGEYVEALNVFKKSLPILKKAENTLGIAYCCCSIGKVHSKLKDHIAAIESIELALKHLENYKDIQAKAYALRAMGEVLQYKGDVVEALDAYDNSAAIYRKTNDRAALSGLLCSMADLKYDTGQYVESQQLYKEAYNLANQASVPRWIARTIFGKAKICFINDDIARSQRMSAKALSILKKVKHRDSLIIEEWIATSYANH